MTDAPDNSLTPDVFDINTRPYGVRAGDNKFGWRVCPFCQRPPTPVCALAVGGLVNDDVFLFRDELSAREHRISGLCQSCQDDIFTTDHTIIN